MSTQLDLWESKDVDKKPTTSKRGGKRRGRNARGRGTSSAGTERARKHIEEAEALSEELGGTDEDVKAYFFALPEGVLAEVLTAYGERYGESKREYAEYALPWWRKGRRKMSGLVASRLFALLPPRMPAADKYRLVDVLWEKYRPTSRAELDVRPCDGVEATVERVREHLQRVVRGYRVPEQLRRRFEWLAAGDVEVRQELLCHFLQRDEAAALDQVRAVLPLLIRQADERADVTRRLTHAVSVGGHRITLRFGTPPKPRPAARRPQNFGDDAAAVATSQARWFFGGIAFLIVVLIALF